MIHLGCCLFSGPFFFEDLDKYFRLIVTIENAQCVFVIKFVLEYIEFILDYIEFMLNSYITSTSFHIDIYVSAVHK